VLRQLHITGLGVIDELDVEPAAGLTVLTGETGAGKTMIATGISLATGARGGAHLVREGTRAAMVQARFDAPDGAEEWTEDGEVILARTIAADGRGSARIGGQLTTAGALGEMGARLVEIHGQHGSLRLLDGATQTTFLDRAAGPQQVRRAAAYRQAYERLLERRRALAALDPDAVELSERAAAVAAEIGDLAVELRDYRERVGLDPERLSEVRERVAALKGLHRKYGETEEEVVAFLEQARGDLAGLQTADERLETLTAEVAEAAATVGELAEELHRVRVATAPPVAAALGEHLGDLGMPGASIDVVVGAIDEPGPAGRDRVELRFRGSAAQPFAPMARVASGGELSRVMLACRSVLAGLDDVPTLVFDEIDAGIGGEAGLAVGRRLARLATTHQVLVVTHLPQIACFADLHVGVRKRDGVASARVLEGSERVAELSRMLAGMEASEHALSHAEELLDEAERVRAEVR
jgi:DNA repair ATPase RecN